MHQTHMIIDGEQLSVSSHNAKTIYNPANQEPVAVVSPGTCQHARMALEAAKKAFPIWSETSSERRAELLHSAAGLVRERAEFMARLLTQEQGKPLKNARAEILSSADILDYYAEEGRRNIGEWLATSRGRSIVVRQPVGVAALITPWNYPVDLLSWKVGPCLAAGCTFVAKPPSSAPVAATEFLRAVSEAGLPGGAVNVVHGPGNEVGAELVENPISRKIAFTGQTETGRWIMARAANQIKRVSLELGGHAPFIVCADTDIEKAAAACAQRAFSNMGQICISVNRVYVAEEVAGEFSERLVHQAEKLRIGNGLEENVDLGPMFSHEQRAKTKEHLKDALDKGADLLYGGREPEGEAFDKGYFFLPTVLGGVDHSMRIMREETFGPVAPIMSFKTIDEAIRLANDTNFGLAAYIYTRDMATGIHAAERLEAGGVGVNINNVMDYQMPFGGWKESGIGRELGHYGLESFLEIKHIRLGI